MSTEAPIKKVAVSCPYCGQEQLNRVLMEPEVAATTRTCQVCGQTYLLVGKWAPRFVTAPLPDMPYA